MKPDWARLMVTESGLTDEKCWAKTPSFKAKTDSGLGLCNPSGHFATDLSNTASIFPIFFGFFKRRWWKTMRFSQVLGRKYGMQILFWFWGDWYLYLWWLYWRTLISVLTLDFLANPRDFRVELDYPIFWEKNWINSFICLLIYMYPTILIVPPKMHYSIRFFFLLGFTFWAVIKLILSHNNYKYILQKNIKNI